MQITFGTDGWRDVIAERFTFDNVRVTSEALSALARNRLAGRPAGSAVASGRGEVERSA